MATVTEPRRPTPVQRGVALVTALLVVALATIAAVAVVSSNQLFMRRTANLLQSDQALLFTLGVEGWAGQVLRRDRESNATDNLGEGWARQLPPVEVEGGSVQGQLTDQQGLFNLNSLVTREGRHDATAFGRFRRLLEQLELDPNLADAVIDWIDPDQDPTLPAGAEDSAYLGLDPPRRGGNRYMASVSELRLVAGVEDAIYRKLSPHLSALPEPTPINVNTAGATLLRAVAPGLSEGEAMALVEERGKRGWTSVEKFVTDPQLKGKQALAQGLTVASSYFMLTSNISIGRVHQRWHHLLSRSGKGEVRLLWRSQTME